jgi:hypothetical protein
MRIRLFKILFWLSVILFLPLLATVDQCEGESYGRMGGNEISNLLIFSGFILLLHFVIYFLDGIVLLIKKIFKRRVNNSELKFLVILILILFLWVVVTARYSNNGKCDWIIGPADTGFCIAMLFSVLINYWKLQILTKNKPHGHS